MQAVGTAGGEREGRRPAFRVGKGWNEPIFYCFPQGISKKHPLLLINSKVVEYNHAQHRALPALRKRAPDPYLEISTEKAKDLDLRDRDCVIVGTPFGGTTLRTRLIEGIAYDIVCAQNGWWQACHALGLAGYDPYSLKAANVNLLYQTDKIDPISGSLPIRGYPCNVRKA